MPQTEAAEWKRHEAYYPNGGKGWEYTYLIWSDDEQRNYELINKHAANVVRPANVALEQVHNHLEFRVNALKTAIVVWTAVGLLAIVAK